MMNKSGKRNHRAKDLITIGICTVIMKVLYLVVFMPFMPIISVTLPIVWGVCMLVSAPVYLLMTYKVAKRGTVLLFCTVMGLFNALMGYIILLPFMLIAGIICELIMWKQGSYRSFWRNTVTYSIYSALSLVGSYLPIYLYGNEYFAQAGFTGELAEVYSKYAMSPAWVSVAVIATMILAVIGCFIGRKLLKKHFIKSGIISASAVKGTL